MSRRDWIVVACVVAALVASYVYSLGWHLTEEEKRERLAQDCYARFAAGRDLPEECDTFRPR